MNREHALHALADKSPWDVLIVGGGATGLGAVVDAAARGYRALLLEQHDFAKGTSSRSTKLVHGGVRYLQQGNVGLVLEALRERGLLTRNAPHLVRHQPFIVPNYAWWEAPFYGIGLKLYDALAGQLGLGPSQHLSREEVLARLPTLQPEGLRGGVVYYDGQFDDARLAICLARTAATLGATALNYVRVTGFIKENGFVRGVRAQDVETRRAFTVRARVVVNATGVFTDALRRMDDDTAPGLIACSQGVHIVLDRSFLPGDSAIMVPRTDDGRVLFAIPWHDRALIGTTDTPVHAPELEPRPLSEEIHFLLEHAARYLTQAPRPADVLSAFAGLRPLVKSDGAQATAALARDHLVLVSPSGLVTVTGGKWTTYRKMAEDAIDQAAAVGELEERPCRTRELRLFAAPEAGPGGGTPGGGALQPLGTEQPELEALMAAQPALAGPLHPRLPYRIGHIVWAARHEMARTVEDVLARRTRALLLDARASVEAAPRVAAVLAQELGRGRDWEQAQVRTYAELARGYAVE